MRKDKDTVRSDGGDLPLTQIERQSTPARAGFESLQSHQSLDPMPCATFDGSIYVSTDSGATWATTTAPEVEWYGVSSSADGTKLAAVSDCDPACTTEDGYVYTSDDGGVMWATSTAPEAGWSDIDSSADGAKLVAVSACDPTCATDDGHIYIGTLNSSTGSGGGATTPGSNGAPAGLLSPGALTSLPSFLKPRPQIDYPGGKVTYLDEANTAKLVPLYQQLLSLLEQELSLFQKAFH